MVKVHYPPTTPFVAKDSLKIFLAGTIDMGNSIDWQAGMIQYIIECFPNENIEIMNPRRLDWDSSWEQHPNHPMFNAQVNWELNQLDEADVILMVLLEGSQSPISLMELGSSKTKPVFVYNPEKFHRWGNVEIFCKRNKILTFNDWDDYLIAVKRFLGSYIFKITKNIPNA